MKPFICAANWKMNKTPDETKSFLDVFKPLMKGVDPSAVRTLIFPSTINIPILKEALQGSPIFWGAQNCYFEESGAFTGENSPLVFKKLGAHYILIGHSERRHVFGESNEWISQKVTKVQSLDMIPLLCIGEKLEEREAGQTEAICREQLKEGLKKADFSKPIVIAYEPVWAIGTGKVASPEQVQETHAQVRKILVSIAGAQVAEKIPVLYGGSVTPANSQGLKSLPNVDGFLVGGASLDPQKFFQLIQTVL